VLVRARAITNTDTSRQSHPLFTFLTSILLLHLLE
jgi:hypothetical protein